MLIPHLEINLKMGCIANRLATVLNFVIIAVFIGLRYSSALNFTVGIICSNASITSWSGFQRSAAALSIAVDEFKNELIKDHTIM